MASIEKRLQALEAPLGMDGNYLPKVVPDETHDSELQRLRRAGHEVYRFSDVLELFV